MVRTQHQTLIVELKNAEKEYLYHKKIFDIYRKGFYRTCVRKNKSLNYLLIFEPKGLQKIDREILAELRQQLEFLETRILITKSKLYTLRLPVC